MVSLTNFKIVSELSNLSNDELTPSSHIINHQHHFNNHNGLKNNLNIATIDSKHSITDKNFIPNGQRLNSEPFEIRWNNLNYQVERKWYRQKLGSLTSASSSNQQNGSQVKSKTNILNSLSGSVKSGEVTAVLGPSGAGKTSLLGCLTGKNKSGVSGSVQVISNRNEPMSICTIPQKGKLRNIQLMIQIFNDNHTLACGGFRQRPKTTETNRNYLNDSSSVNHTASSNPEIRHDISKSHN